MALTYSALGKLLADTNLLVRVDYAMMNAAIAIVAEVNTTPSHAARVTFAQKVFAGTYDVRRALLAVLQNSTIVGEIVPANTPDMTVPDTDIQFAVNSVFNALAGVAT